jgi:hypothetical protein
MKWGEAREISMGNAPFFINLGKTGGIQDLIYIVGWIRGGVWFGCGYYWGLREKLLRKHMDNLLINVIG